MKKSFLVAAIVLSALGLSACWSDDLTPAQKEFIELRDACSKNYTPKCDVLKSGDQ